MNTLLLVLPLANALCAIMILRRRQPWYALATAAVWVLAAYFIEVVALSACLALAGLMLQIVSFLHFRRWSDARLAAGSESK